MEVNNHYGKTIKLAIVIPAYKAKFLSETLESIASQTDKRFCVYIGDDYSPENIGSIVGQYEGKFEYVYKRFEDNLGGRDLVAQWERCIDMTQGEEWIWLFSDDDYMDATCVEAFYRSLAQKDINADLYRFNVRRLNNSIIYDSTLFPKLVNSAYLFKNKMKGNAPCFAVEYIFSRKIYLQENKFQNFDLAWHSDIATWMKFGVNGIITIDKAFVTWRDSGENITPQADTTTLKRKWDATVAFFVWVKSFMKKHSFHLGLFSDVTFIRVLHGSAKGLSKDYCIEKSYSYIGVGIRKCIMITFIYVYDYLSKLVPTK